LSFGRGARSWFVAIVVVGFAALLAAGLLTGSEAGAGRSADTQGPPRSTLTGSYLAALHAASDREEAVAASYYLAALERAPKDPVLLTSAITALVLDGRTKDAIPYARRLVAEDPASETGRLVLAVAAIADGRYGQAETELKALPTSLHATTTVPLLSAWAAFGRGDMPAALAAVRGGEASPSSTYLSLLHLAWLKDAAGDSRGAADDLSKLLETQKEPWLRLARLGIGVFNRAGREDAANALQQQYLSHQPESSALAVYVKEQPGYSELRKARDGAAEALFDASGVFARQNDRETALLLGQLGLYLKPDFPALQLVVADLLESVGRLADANRVYAAIRSSSPLAWVGRLSMAQNLDQLDQFTKAEAILRAMAKERPADPEALIQLGDLLRRHERYPEAVAVYDEAAARIPTLDKRHWRLLYARGISLERSKQWERAEADFLKALELEPDQPFVLNYLGYSWVEQGQNLGRAEELIKRAVQLRPNDGYIVDSLGWVLYRLGRPEEAVAPMERAVELRPEDPVINDHLGDVYWAVGRQREARFQWRAALSRDPEPDLRATIEQKLQRGLIKEANAAP
jgi:Putative Zn-dependent protease, contains TPR repeats